MNQPCCKCGHEKRDHQRFLGATRFGACKICLCNQFDKPAVVVVAVPAATAPAK